MHRSHLIRLSTALVASLAIALLAGSPVFAAKGKSVQNEAEWVSFDEAAKTVTVKILSKGKGNKKLMKQFKDVKRGKEATFNVIPTGSVLKRTSVAVNGVKGEITDIAPGKRVLLYWVEDPNKAGELFARKIDVVFTDEEIEKRLNISDE